MKNLETITPEDIKKYENNAIKAAIKDEKERKNNMKNLETITPEEIKKYENNAIKAAIKDAKKRKNNIKHGGQHDVRSLTSEIKIAQDELSR